jgi:hypothetical protein
MTIFTVAFQALDATPHRKRTETLNCQHMYKMKKKTMFRYVLRAAQVLGAQHRFSISLAHFILFCFIFAFYLFYVRCFNK